MIRTFFSRLRHTAQRSRSVALPRPRALPAVAPAARGIPPLGSESGFLLIEVMISALLVALIVVATLTGFDVTNRATADERSHAQATVLAQQDEDRLRGLQISALSGLSETRKVTYNGTVYEIKSTAKFISDATGTESCTAAAASADYIQTTSSVTWPALKTRPPVVETGLIAPHLGGSLLVKVIDTNGKGVLGMTVKATGPSPSVSTETGTTNTNGCVIFGSVEPGEYKVTTFQTGYVEKDGNEEPPVSERVATVTNGSTTLKEFQFDRAGELAVSFENPSTKVAVSGDAFLAFNTNMTLPSYKTFPNPPKLGTLETTIISPKKLFPFTGAYTVYAGSCPADEPEANNKAIKNPSVILPSGGRGEVTVPMPPIKVLVMSGTEKVAGKEGVAIKATGTLIDTGCEKEKVEPFTRTIETNSEGKLPNPGMPYGTYSLCVTAVIGKNRKFTTAVKNNEAAGVTVPTIYLGKGEEKAGCP